MRINVILPAYNEEATICGVIRDFHRELPHAEITVVDNASTDGTARLARMEMSRLKCRGSIIREQQKGKANAIRRAFAEIDSDIYVVSDADRTYPAKAVHSLIAPVANLEADMVVGDRISGGIYRKQNKRMFHGFGNHLVRHIINSLFHTKLKDIMSGYRVFSKKFVKNFPILSEGFEIETEMTLHALDKRFCVREIPVIYRNRPSGSVSKLHTVRDGFAVLRTIFGIFRHYRPMAFFGLLSAFCFIGASGIGLPVIIEFLQLRYVYKVPSAILSTGLMILSILLFSVGLILDTVVTNHKFDYENNLIKFKK